MVEVSVCNYAMVTISNHLQAEIYVHEPLHIPHIMGAQMTVPAHNSIIQGPLSAYAMRLTWEMYISWDQLRAPDRSRDSKLCSQANVLRCYLIYSWPERSRRAKQWTCFYVIIVEMRQIDLQMRYTSPWSKDWQATRSAIGGYQLLKHGIRRMLSVAMHASGKGKRQNHDGSGRQWK